MAGRHVVNRTACRQRVGFGDDKCLSDRALTVLARRQLQLRVVVNVDYRQRVLTGVEVGQFVRRLTCDKLDVVLAERRFAFDCRDAPRVGQVRHAAHFHFQRARSRAVAVDINVFNFANYDVVVACKFQIFRHFAAVSARGREAITATSQAFEQVFVRAATFRHDFVERLDVVVAVFVDFVIFIAVATEGRAARHLHQNFGVAVARAGFVDLHGAEAKCRLGLVDNYRFGLRNSLSINHIDNVNACRKSSQIIYAGRVIFFHDDVVHGDGVRRRTVVDAHVDFARSLTFTIHVGLLLDFGVERAAVGDFHCARFLATFVVDDEVLIFARRQIFKAKLIAGLELIAVGVVPRDGVRQISARNGDLYLAVVDAHVRDVRHGFGHDDFVAFAHFHVQRRATAVVVFHSDCVGVGS